MFYLGDNKPHFEDERRLSHDGKLPTSAATATLNSNDDDGNSPNNADNVTGMANSSSVMEEATENDLQVKETRDPTRIGSIGDFAF